MLLQPVPFSTRFGWLPHGRVVSQIDRAKDSKSSATIVRSGIADHRATAAAKPVAKASVAAIANVVAGYDATRSADPEVAKAGYGVALHDRVYGSYPLSNAGDAQSFYDSAVSFANIYPQGEIADRAVADRDAPKPWPGAAIHYYSGESAATTADRKTGEINSDEVGSNSEAVGAGVTAERLSVSTYDPGLLIV